MRTTLPEPAQRPSPLFQPLLARLPEGAAARTAPARATSELEPRHSAAPARSVSVRPRPAPVAVRWTVGDVTRTGFEALRLSLWGAHRIFGPEAPLAVCVNTIPVQLARRWTGPVPPGVTWHDVSSEVPAFLAPHLDSGMAEGVGWKFARLRLFPDCYELALDNDCILWRMPEAVRAWLGSTDGQCLVAADVRACFGQFADLCGTEPRNSGMRGTPPGFSLEAALLEVLRRRPVLLKSELDEQGLVVAALSQHRLPAVVSTDDVTISSPFPPHQPHLGRCGAHFVGLNARHLPWCWNGRPAAECHQDHWRQWRSAVAAAVGIAVDADVPVTVPSF